jgi:hypothetical protein
MNKNLLLSALFLFFSSIGLAQELSSDQILSNSIPNSIQTEINKITQPTTSDFRFGGGGGGNCDSIGTLYGSNNGLTGCMFDLVAVTDIEVQYFYGNMGTGTNDCIIFYKNGSHVGYEGDSTVWTSIGTASVTSMQDIPVLIPISINLAITAGDTMAFYIARQSGGSIRYTDGTTLGSVYSGNGFISILEGNGVSYPFGFTIGPRVWNGSVISCPLTVGVDEFSSQEKFFNVNINEAENKFVVRLSDSYLNGNSSLFFVVNDLSGRIIYRDVIDQNEKSFYTPALSEGIYICTLQSADQVIEQKKVIVH